MSFVSEETEKRMTVLEKGVGSEKSVNKFFGNEREILRENQTLAFHSVVPGHLLERVGFRKIIYLIPAAVFSRRIERSVSVKFINFVSARLPA